MGIFKKALKAGIAAKLVQEARKPHNQAKAKNLLQSFKNRNDRHGAPKPRSTGYR